MNEIFIRTIRWVEKENLILIALEGDGDQLGVAHEIVRCNDIVGRKNGIGGFQIVGDHARIVASQNNV